MPLKCKHAFVIPFPGGVNFLISLGWFVKDFSDTETIIEIPIFRVVNVIVIEGIDGRDFDSSEAGQWKTRTNKMATNLLEFAGH